MDDVRRLKEKRQSDEHIEILAYIYRRDPYAIQDLRKELSARLKLAKELNFGLNKNYVLLLDAVLNGGKL